MLIRSELFGIDGKSAIADARSIAAASLPTLGLLLLICP
jgi:hypothetical protein